MPRLRPRLATLAASTLAAALVLTGCAAGSSETPSTADAGAGSGESVTIEHAFGETVVPADPQNVVTLGWGSTDAAIALGTIPVAIPFDSYAGDENGVLPWVAEAVEAAGADLPTVLPESPDEPPYEAIAEADPDVILAVYSGITEEQYETLSQIAPTVAYPGEAWSTPWRDVVTTVGEALGKSTEAEEVLAGIDDQLAEQAAAHPEFEGKTIAAVWDIAGTFYVYKKEDPRVEFMLDLGFESAPSVDELANGDSTFFSTLSYEQLDQLEADVVLSYSDTQAEADAFLTAPQTSVIPAVKAGTVAQLVGTEYIAAVSPPTALSLPWGLDQLVEALAAGAE
ncbi:iron-siderophore ABC transporter substrate-binding protein [Herbiconiux sp. CPCC 203407]|uniref:Iron-siderophore ABC transporter substrate-binding protein n=1 Tax=Herbiconiux oxytropis TaxID=2970915 RepID=A0AA41XHE6_9MICO|nr:iron-siderophore ABC transporter substrate-binding protein [Herbiconiux oxytropis]MCS5720697.1 iron-siderophore ABC transporter substrate-binding protein [Herbiconiux oxytropis]MCS5724976.1 iron-siderophore ABC transporter substrate-binding protein [Herbiconiux oxytropis]